jgi:acid phosphatase (class A)
LLAVVLVCLFIQRERPIMISTKRLLLAGCFALSLAVPAFAADPYLTGKMLDLVPLMAPPPVKGSPADMADLQAVIDAQAHASEARKAQTVVDSEETIYVMFSSVLGAKFVPAALPKTSELFARISASEDDTLDAAKPAFGRPRPWMGHPDQVKAIAKPSKSGSYPSGHTTQVTIDAIVLSEMVPEKKAEIWARAGDYAESRVIGGMHYPTDIEAGWRAGTAMAVVMLEQPGFRADVEAAKVELRAVLGLK